VPDPTFDPPGDYPIGDRVLTKTAGPALTPDQLGAIDVVLLSHDQHPDNLDRSGRAFLATVPLVVTTGSAARRIGGNSRALATWRHVDVPGPNDGERVRITAVPAQHGPDGSAELVGEVTGFVLSGTGLPTVYVSGDNASLQVVRCVAERFPRIDIAVLFAGAARTPLLGAADLTLNADAAVTAAELLGVSHVVPVHIDGWRHFTQGAAQLSQAFAVGGFENRLVVIRPGDTAIL